MGRSDGGAAPRGRGRDRGTETAEGSLCKEKSLSRGVSKKFVSTMHLPPTNPDRLTPIGRSEINRPWTVSQIPSTPERYLVCRPSRVAALHVHARGRGSHRRQRRPPTPRAVHGGLHQISYARDCAAGPPNMSFRWTEAARGRRPSPWHGKCRTRSTLCASSGRRQCRFRQREG